MKNKVLCLMASLVIYSIFALSFIFLYEGEEKPQTTNILSVEIPNFKINSSESMNNLESHYSSFSSSQIFSIPQIPKIPEDEEIVNKTLIQYPKVSRSSCKIQDIEFTAKEYRFIFNFKEYSSCETPDDDIVLFTNNTIIAKCIKSKPLYSVDPGLPQRLGGKYKEEVKWSQSAQIHPNSEYAFIKCRDTHYTLFFLRANKSVSNRANQIRDSFSNNSIPMNVLVLVLDSVSRFTSYKFLPKLTEYLQDRKNYNYNDYSVYEFTRVATPDIFTMPNIIQIVYGESVERAKKSIKIERPDNELDSPEHLIHQKEKSIWDYYKKAGYATMFLKDTVHDYLNKFLGREISADHVFENYWRAAWAVYGFNDFSSRQRCYGRQNSHNLTFGYTYDFFKNYETTNKFAYVHLDAAHESSGNIQTVDLDLLNFMKSLTKLFKTTKQSFAIYLISDHGYKFEKLNFDIRGYIDIRSPLNYLMLSSDIESKLNAKSNLIHNSQMLTGRFDLNYMLKFLAYFPYDNKGSGYFEQLRGEYEVKDVVNLLIERVSPLRTCQALGVEKVFCICSGYEILNKESEFDAKVVKEAQDLALKKLNIKAGKASCKFAEKIEFVKGEKMNLSDPDRGGIWVFNMEFRVNGNIIANGKFNYCLDNKAKLGALFDRKEFPISSYQFGKEKVFLQIIEIRIKNICGSRDCIC